jgi:hypothetical protein
MRSGESPLRKVRLGLWAPSFRHRDHHLASRDVLCMSRALSLALLNIAGPPAEPTRVRSGFVVLRRRRTAPRLRRSKRPGRQRSRHGPRPRYSGHDAPQPAQRPARPAARRTAPARRLPRSGRRVCAALRNSGRRHPAQGSADRLRASRTITAEAEVEPRAELSARPARPGRPSAWLSPRHAGVRAPSRLPDRPRLRSSSAWLSS